MGLSAVEESINDLKNATATKDEVTHMTERSVQDLEKRFGCLQAKLDPKESSKAIVGGLTDASSIEPANPCLGDAFKKAAQTALISEKDAARARTLLESATECYAWAELTPEAMGLPRVYESIGFLEVRNDADGRVEAAFDKFKQAPPDYLEAQAKMAAATKLYASAGEAKLAKDIAVVETMIGCAATLDEIDQVVSKGQGGGGGGGAGEVEGDAGEEAEAPAATLTFLGPLPKSGYSPKAAVEAAKPAYQALATLKKDLGAAQVELDGRAVPRAAGQGARALRPLGRARGARLRQRRQGDRPRSG